MPHKLGGGSKAAFLISLLLWEGSKGRGKAEESFTPTSVLPQQGGENTTISGGSQRGG